MKHIYDIFDKKKFLYQTIGGSLTMAFLGFLFVYFCLGCSKQIKPPESARPLGHDHRAECWHKRDYKCELDKTTMEFLMVGTDSFHCKYLRCSICGQFLKK